MDVAKEVAKCNSIIKDAVSMLENINQSHLKSIDGINKLKQKTEKEISFLEKVILFIGILCSSYNIYYIKYVVTLTVH